MTDYFCPLSYMEKKKHKTTLKSHLTVEVKVMSTKTESSDTMCLCFPSVKLD